MENLEQFGNVMEVQSCGRFVEDVECPPGGSLGEFLSELDALRLTARQRGSLLADLDVSEADAASVSTILSRNGRHRLKRSPQASSTVMSEHVGNRLVA